MIACGQQGKVPGMVTVLTDTAETVVVIVHMLLGQLWQLYPSSRHVIDLLLDCGRGRIIAHSDGAQGEQQCC